MLRQRHIDVIDKIFDILKKNPQKISIVKENLEIAKQKKNFSPTYISMWEELLCNKSLEKIHLMMKKDDEIGETLRSTSIFTRII